MSVQKRQTNFLGTSGTPEVGVVKIRPPFPNADGSAKTGGVLGRGTINCAGRPLNQMGATAHTLYTWPYPDIQNIKQTNKKFIARMSTSHIFTEVFMLTAIFCLFLFLMFIVMICFVVITISIRTSVCRHCYIHVTLLTCLPVIYFTLSFFPI